MPRRLPRNRRCLRLMAISLAPIYLVLWIAGTGCFGELYMYDVTLARCLFVMNLLLEDGVTEAELLDVLSGVEMEVPDSMLGIAGSTGSGTNEGVATLRHYRAGMLEQQIDYALHFSALGAIDDDDLIEGFQLQPGDRLALLIALEDVLADLFAQFTLDPVGLDPVDGSRVPSFRFPEAAGRAKFSMVFDAKLGVPYDLPAGELVLDGSVAVSEGARGEVPRKVIVEVAHLNASGKVKRKHKQTIKINQGNGVFKTSRKDFKGFEVQEGERIRLRFKSKGGDVTGLDWMLQSTYRRLEPADGLVYHGTSPTISDVDEYIAALGDPSVHPAVEGMHAGVPGTRPQFLEQNTREFLERVGAAGRIPHLSYSMTIGEGEPVDDVIAQSDTYDDLIRAIGRAIRDHGDPVFVRIGFEFNGSWNGYHPGVYPAAFRKVVDLLREEGARNFSTIWCYEPDAPGDFDAVDKNGQPLWYPGDGYVDWFGIDLFQHGHFTDDGRRREGNTPYARTLGFLEMARDHGKPVYLSELSAVDAHLTSDGEDPGFADGKADWELWFEPFFEFLEAHPEIKGFNYMSQDYRGTQFEANGWGNAKIQDNSYVKQQWIERLRDNRFLHAPDV